MTSAWPNLSDLLVAATDAAAIGLIGAPLAAGSVTPGRCDLAPAELRKVLRRVGRFDIDREHELRSRIADHGDLPIAGLSIEEATGPIVEAVAESVERHALTLLIGGNNAVTRPGVHGIARAVGAPLDRVGLITIDAHFDMRDTANGLGNGNPVRALLEDGLPGRNIAQIGLTPFANSKAMHSDALQGGNRVIPLAEFERIGWQGAVEGALDGLANCEVLVVDCDIDVIDRSQFPGAPGARPAGMQARDFFAVARRLAEEPRVALIDLTEWDPPLDPSDLSSLVAGRWLAEVLGGFESRA
jgi:arginase family enzyme